MGGNTTGPCYQQEHFLASHFHVAENLGNLGTLLEICLKTILLFNNVEVVFLLGYVQVSIPKSLSGFNARNRDRSSHQQVSLIWGMALPVFSGA